jgi:hypothetical protein
MQQKRFIDNSNQLNMFRAMILSIFRSTRQSSAPEDGRNHRPNHVELIGIINKPLLLHLVGYLYYMHISLCICIHGIGLV